MSKKKGLLFTSVAFLLGVFISSFTGYLALAHGGDTNLIHICVGTGVLNNGRVRIVSPTTNCNSNETALDWHKGTNFAPFTCSGCNLSNSNGRYANKDMTNAFLDHTFLDGQDISGSTLKNSYLNSTTISSANATNTDFSGSDFLSTIAYYTNFSGAKLNNVKFDGAILTGATGLTATSVSGSIWTSTFCPDGTNSDDNGNTCVGHLNP